MTSVQAAAARARLRDGVALHAITAEPGGDVTVKQRLFDRNTTLSYPVQCSLSNYAQLTPLAQVHSDPKFKLLLPSKDGTTSLHVKTQMYASRFSGRLDKKGGLQQVDALHSPPPKLHTSILIE